MRWIEGGRVDKKSVKEEEEEEGKKRKDGLSGEKEERDRKCAGINNSVNTRFGLSACWPWADK